MSFTSLLIHSVQLILQSEGAEDRYGNTTQVFTPGATVNARVQPVRSTSQGGRELLANRDMRVAWFQVFLPAGTAIDALDMLTWNGKTLQIDGPPALVYDGTGEHHIEAVARLIEGG